MRLLIGCVQAAKVTNLILTLSLSGRLMLLSVGRWLGLFSEQTAAASPQRHVPGTSARCSAIFIGRRSRSGSSSVCPSVRAAVSTVWPVISRWKHSSNGRRPRWPPPPFFHRDKLASCLIHARALQEYVIFTVWLRSVNKMLRSVKFAEDKMLVFFILCKKC